MRISKSSNRIHLEGIEDSFVKKGKTLKGIAIHSKLIELLARCFCRVIKCKDSHGNIIYLNTNSCRKYLNRHQIKTTQDIRQSLERLQKNSALSKTHSRSEVKMNSLHFNGPLEAAKEERDPINSEQKPVESENKLSQEEKMLQEKRQKTAGKLQRLPSEEQVEHLHNITLLDLANGDSLTETKTSKTASHSTLVKETQPTVSDVKLDPVVKPAPEPISWDVELQLMCATSEELEREVGACRILAQKRDVPTLCRLGLLRLLQDKPQPAIMTFGYAITENSALVIQYARDLKSKEEQFKSQVWTMARNVTNEKLETTLKMNKLSQKFAVMSTKLIGALITLFEMQGKQFPSDLVY